MLKRLALGVGTALALSVITATVTTRATTSTTDFDFHTGNSAIEVIIPAVVPPLFQTTAANDAPIILRHTTLITNAWFDAIAPYHPTGIGVYSNIGRQPIEERTDRNRNIAMFYASYRVLNSMMPRYQANWRAMLQSVGLDPDFAGTSPTSAAGIGNAAGFAVVAARERDGMNQLGDEGGKQYNLRPYADYTGFIPVNSPWELTNPSRWQPLVETTGNGTFRAQQFITPQWALTRPYSYNSPSAFNVAPPTASNHKRKDAYKAQADEVMAIQAELTDLQKMVAELFDNKITSLGFSALFMSLSRGHSLEQFVQYDFLTNMAAFDGGIATWDQKFRWDAVRPVTAIHYLYGDRKVTGWAGPGRGVVSDLPAGEWRSYLPTGNHPEYPSGSACFCSAHAQATRRFFGSDAMGWSVPVTAGSSVIEPGVTPATDLTLGPWNTLTDFETDCGQSRVWGGVHFKPSVDEAHALCRPMGDRAYEYLQTLLNGGSE